MIQGVDQRFIVDFNQIPFVQAVMENLSQHPTAGSGDSGPLVLGRFYYNTNDNVAYIYTQIGWLPIVMGSVLKKKVFVIGDAIATSFTLNHNMNTMDLAVTARATSSPYAIVNIDMEFSNTNSITVRSTWPLATDEISVTIVG